MNTYKMKDFYHEDFGTVRVIYDNEKLWFCVQDLKHVIGSSNVHYYVNRYCDPAGVASYVKPNKRGVCTKHKFILLSNVYRIVLRKASSVVEAFEQWVWGVMLPEFVQNPVSSGKEVVHEVPVESGSIVDNEEDLVLTTEEVDDSSHDGTIQQLIQEQLATVVRLNQQIIEMSMLTMREQPAKTNSLTARKSAMVQ